MAFLFLSLLASVAIFLFFKFFHLKEVPLLKAVAINYFACTLTGLIYHYEGLRNIDYNQLQWMPYAFLMGCTFFFTFFLMGRTTAINGVTAASMATKLSLVFPALISILILRTTSFSFFLLFALIFAIPAIILASLKKGENESQKRGFILPVVVFVLSGLIDGTLNILNFNFSENPTFIHFPGAVFFFAAMAGLVFHLIKRSSKSDWGGKNLWVGGIGLGIANYFSIEFLLQGLKFFNNDGALVFPFLNLGVIVMSSISGILLFRERLSKVNIIGIFLAVVSLGLLIFSSR